MLRTHTCGQLRENDVDKKVVLCGWVHARRDHGKIIFIDLRDGYGLTQVVFLPKPHTSVYERAKELSSEDVIRIKGTVNFRPKGTENLKISTGLIEVLAENIEVLNHCEELPFTIENNIETAEDIRLHHRYLDLRRRVVYEKIFMRHQFNQAFRTFLNGKGFIEIETPYLSKSTPEGARDFLVPSRLNQNKFYALPQSPQLFKQILMVGGVDKYYQIVRCFRDEDLRKDRQPEFTQLDLEISFVEEDDIFSLTEEMLSYIFREVLGQTLRIPFPRISYKEAMDKYGTDKPFIEESACSIVSGGGERRDYKFLWVVDFPYFEYNEQEKRWQTCHHPFTSPKEEDIPLLEHSLRNNGYHNNSSTASLPKERDLSQIRARSYDLVLNGEEIASGSIRIHSPHLQKKIFKILGISVDEAEKKFGFLLRAFKYGAPPHGGIAFGLDRLYAIMSNSASIREVIAFPKTQKGICPLTDAPSYVEDKQLDELYIRLVENEKELD
jgi:aspartyl-tRNA synthetase